MYSLTLTADERRAFDWVGDRYNSGKVASLLLDCMRYNLEWREDADATSHSGSAWSASWSLPRRGVGWRVENQLVGGNRVPSSFVPLSGLFASVSDAFVA